MMTELSQIINQIEPINPALLEQALGSLKQGRGGQAQAQVDDQRKAEDWRRRVDTMRAALP